MAQKTLGIAAIGLAISFNIPFSMLASRFEYPDILRHPAGEVLQAFAAGGPELILIWYAFALSALAMIPFAVALAFAHDDWQAHPGLSIGAAIAGALAGFAQGAGLVRWVFAVPMLAEAHADPAASEAARAAAETGFALLNQWGGVGIGEHMGQMLTLLWVGLVAFSRRGLRCKLGRIEMGLAVLTLLGIGFGLGEGPTLALGLTIPAFGMATVLGYLAFTLWLIALGFSLLRPERTAAPALA